MATNITTDSKRRQTEINNWYYNYRLDTLFILQLTLLAFSIILLFSIFSKYRLISPIFIVYITVFFLLFIFIVWYFKYSYSKNTRDFYHWNKRRFTGDGETTAIPMEVRSAMNDILSRCNV
uniref:Uncharacterized protein n=1 Tax=viral metagenome TaxID=1070528 RepID=A0A6C0K5W8_9ZZZZ